jgi:hypothetical protein
VNGTARGGVDAQKDPQESGNGISNYAVDFHRTHAHELPIPECARESRSALELVQEKGRTDSYTSTMGPITQETVFLLGKGGAIDGLAATHYRKEKAAMPESEEQSVLKRVHKDQEEGKSPSTQAGEFVREEIHHVREGKHGAKSPQQAIAIGLSKARRAGVPLPPPGRGSSAEVREHAQRDSRKGRSRGTIRPSRKRSSAVLGALRREGHGAATRSALSSQTRASAKRRGSRARRESARRAARTRRTQQRKR